MIGIAQIVARNAKLPKPDILSSDREGFLWPMVFHVRHAAILKRGLRLHARARRDGASPGRLRPNRYTLMLANAEDVEPLRLDAAFAE